jgi:hypothetical protein
MALLKCWVLPHHVPCFAVSPYTHIAVWASPFILFLLGILFVLHLVPFLPFLLVKFISVFFPILAICLLHLILVVSIILLVVYRLCFLALERHLIRLYGDVLKWISNFFREGLIYKTNSTVLPLPIRNTDLCFKNSRG